MLKDKLKISSVIKGENLIRSIAAEIEEKKRRSDIVDYNHRYIDGGPAWGEHTDYNDGGQHGETHRPG
ncbi:MAG: hypothetical protein Q8N39_10400 [Pelolinea sp.]|nr:hypothetical protein [Pelolinea sp.]